MNFRYLLLAPFALQAHAKLAFLAPVSSISTTYSSKSYSLFYSHNSNKSYKRNSKGTYLEKVDFGLMPFEDMAGPSDWFNLSPETEIEGANVDKVYSEFDVSSNELIVAVIDSGVDVNHEDLQGKLWINEDEIPGNNIDDDKNGYIDDIFGWNFLGARDGMAKIIRKEGQSRFHLYKGLASKQVQYESLAITRELKRLLKKQSSQGLSEKEGKRLKEISELISSKRQSHLDSYNRYMLIKAKFEKNKKILQEAGLNTFDFETVFEFSVDPTNTKVLNAKGTMISLLESGMTESRIESSIAWHNVNAQYYYNQDYNSRTIVQDSNNINDRSYGNNDVIGPDASHGTHVAGIIAANRKNTIGINGVAQNVKIMSLRAVPDGDERDKDIANAIRYAVDNGAKIINMSFGKTIADNIQVVEEAIQYAEEHGVLLVHAAGNNYSDNDNVTVYPNKNLTTLTTTSRSVKGWLEVGASSYKKGSSLVAGFSNYGKNTVDLFAPGVNIRSTTPDNQYNEFSGTSMAAPVVAGVAALIWSFDSRLTAEEVKNIILENTRKYPDIYVYKMRVGKVPFSDLSINGGIVDAYQSVKSLLHR